MTASRPEPNHDGRFLEGEAGAKKLSLGRRVYLTYEYHGLATVIFRAVTFPLRFTPLKPLLRLTLTERQRLAIINRWYRRHGRPVTIVIPSYRDTELVQRLVSAIRRTTRSKMVHVVIADDGSGWEHADALRKLDGVELIVGEQNSGFAANANRGLRAADPRHDVVLLNSDVVPQPNWLAALQYATSEARQIGIVTGKLLYPDGRIQYAGTVRNVDAPEWFDHRYRFMPANWGPAGVGGPTLAATGACMYIRREVLDEVGLLDESYPMAYEDVDYCLRTWKAGFQVMYAPLARLYHDESVTRGTRVGQRERTSQQVFWRRWGGFFDERNVRTSDGRLQIVYVTEDTGIGGGHRDIFEHLNRLTERGHDAQLWTLDKPPDWFELKCPVRSFRTYRELTAALSPVQAIKVATWWNTARPVWLASVTAGIPVYFVQDIETSYYPHDTATRNAVLESYRPEFRYMTISSWNCERLRELGLSSSLIPPGIDLETFRPLAGVPRRENMLLALGRSNPLKNLALTIEAWRRLPQPRPELCLFGIEPHLATEPGIRYVERPSDEQVNALFNQATVFMQTSIHEGFCLPPLEAMATGAPVVCTDAHGNRDFCRDGENCLMPEPDPDAVAAAIMRLLTDPELRGSLGSAGLRTAADYAWDTRIDALVSFFEDISRPRRIEPATAVVPGGRVAHAL